MDKLRTMRTYVHVVQNNSFGEAALRLGVSTSLVSKHIADLESQLGVRLLSRTTRHLEVTEIGRRYYEVCMGILRDVEAAEDSLRDLQRSAGGTITVRASHSLVVLYVGRLIAEFSAKYPAIQVNLVVDEDPSHAVLEAQRGLDVAFHAGRLPSDGLAARSLAAFTWNVHGSAAYLKRHGIPRQPAELRKHNCLIHTAATPGGIWSFGSPPHSTQVPVSGSIQSNSFLALRQAAIDGVGLAMLPSFCVHPTGDGNELVRVFGDREATHRELQLLMSPDRRRPKRIRFFVDFAVNWFEQPRWDTLPPM